MTDSAHLNVVPIDSVLQANIFLKLAQSNVGMKNKPKTMLCVNLQ